MESHIQARPAGRAIIPLLLLAYVTLSALGLQQHLRQHPPLQSLYFCLAPPVNLFSLLIAPLLLARPATVAWGYLGTSLVVLFGSIGMAYFAIHDLARPTDAQHNQLGVILVAILLLWAKLLLTHAIWRRNRPPAVARPPRDPS